MRLFHAKNPHTGDFSFGYSEEACRGPLRGFPAEQQAQQQVVRHALKESLMKGEPDDKEKRETRLELSKIWVKMPVTILPPAVMSLLWLPYYCYTGVVAYRLTRSLKPTPF